MSHLYNVAKKSRPPNPLKMDPTRTASLRRAFEKNLKVRFARLRLNLYTLLVTEDVLGLTEKNLHPFGPFRSLNSSVTNAGRWQFSSTPEKVKAFKAWLKTQIKTELTGRDDEAVWRTYVEMGLKKGAGRAFDDTRKPQRTRAALEGKMDFYRGTRDEFLRSSFHQPVAIEKVQLLSGRSFDELENVTSDMANRMTRDLTDGLVRGASPREIARDLDVDLDIGRGRATTIARTEIIRAHAEGQLMALEGLGVEEVGVAVEWSTTGDDKVCELCAPLEGVVLTLDEAKGMLPRHSNCRCAWVPANVGEDKESQKDTKAAIGRALDSSVDEEGGFESSRWVGADLEPSSSRPQSQVGNEDYLASFSREMYLLNCGGPGSGVPGPCPAGGSKGDSGKEKYQREKAARKARQAASVLAFLEKELSAEDKAAVEPRISKLVAKLKNYGMTGLTKTAQTVANGMVDTMLLNKVMGLPAGVTVVKIAAYVVAKAYLRVKKSLAGNLRNQTIDEAEIILAILSALAEEIGVVPPSLEEIRERLSQEEA